jgi:hypothetical protein
LEVDFDALLKDYEQLKASKLLRKQCFPQVPKSRFYEVFYPHIPMPTSFSSQTAPEDQVEHENMSKSAVESRLNDPGKLLCGDQRGIGRRG